MLTKQLNYNHILMNFDLSRSENSEMHQAKDRIKREQQLMYRENERLSKHIERLEREMYVYRVHSFCYGALMLYCMRIQAY